MLQTPLFDFPYPEDTDDPNGPLQVQALAEAVEDKLKGNGLGGVSWIEQSESRSAAGYAALTTPDRIDLPGVASPALIEVAASAYLKRTGGSGNVGMRLAIYDPATPGTVQTAGGTEITMSSTLEVFTVTKPHAGLSTDDPTSGLYIALGFVPSNVLSGIVANALRIEMQFSPLSSGGSVSGRLRFLAARVLQNPA